MKARTWLHHKQNNIYELRTWTKKIFSDDTKIHAFREEINNEIVKMPDTGLYLAKYHQCYKLTHKPCTAYSITYTIKMDSKERSSVNLMIVKGKSNIGIDIFLICHKDDIGNQEILNKYRNSDISNRIFVECDRICVYHASLEQDQELSYVARMIQEAGKSLTKLLENLSVPGNDPFEHLFEEESEAGKK